MRKAHPEAARDVRQLDEREVQKLGVGQVLPGKAREEHRLRILEACPEQRGGHGGRNPAVPEEDHPAREKPRVEAQVQGQQHHHGNAQRQGQLAVVDDDVGHPVHEPHVLHETGENPREHRLRECNAPYCKQQRDQRHPGDGPVAELGKREHEESPGQGGQARRFCVGPCLSRCPPSQLGCL